MSSSGEPDSGPASADEGVDRLVGELADEAAFADPGDRVLGVHVDPAEADDRHPVVGVHDRLADRAQRRDRRFALLAGADAGAVDRQQRPAADRLGHVRERRRGDEADHRGDLVGLLDGPVAVGADRVGADLGREDERAGVDLGKLEHVDVQGGDDRVAAAAPAQRPEEVGAVLGVDRALLARRR